ncbi:Nif3-like dinuclear metal center hexameric protein [Gracilibacillus massiliensis]|uniref:Nif3-like dinuclear metal center hexameric protein n=1 Tax=Gracilibacillus massiliensis TaxID=1564956 RepID=UPI00071C424B|nr:Nif3-like dinuclear metal center hexameric protein [Gracilibacillus massiliensis]
MVQVQDVIHTLISNVEAVDNTVDTLKFGDLNQEVNKVAVTFMPTYEVIKGAISTNIDLLICHEGLFYSHGNLGVIEESEVYQQKRDLIEDSGLAIFRLHDYVHSYQPDGIMQGIIQTLQWQGFVRKNERAYSIFEIPKQQLIEVLSYLKDKLDINPIRYIGDLTTEIKHIALLVGFRGGGITAIPPFIHEHVDLVIYGEGPEWETPEYVRDAIAMKKNKAAIILGHYESEAPGMVYVTEELKRLLPNIEISYLPSKNCIQVL